MGGLASSLVGFIWLVVIAIYVLEGLSFYKLATKAGLERIGWFAWVPILNTILMLRIIGKSGWWILMFLVPIANVIFAIIWYVKLLNAFGKSGWWVLLVILLPDLGAIVMYVLWVVWAFDSNTTYHSPA